MRGGQQLRSMFRQDRKRGDAAGATAAVATGELPMPPPEMRELVGPTDVNAFDNPTGALVYPYVAAERYESFFDFGCGCGRVARQLIQQTPRPRRYVGVDLHRGMVEWAQRNLAPAAENFEFHHHNVHNVRFNPDGVQPPVSVFPVDDKQFSMVHALSVFTHLTQAQTEHYLPEVARILRDDGVFLGSWFLFDKTFFPMLPDSHNALYVEYVDPSAAVIYDRRWIERLAAENGLIISHIVAPEVRGHQWVLVMEAAASGARPAQWPPDEAPIGRTVPPQGPADAHRVR